MKPHRLLCEQTSIVKFSRSYLNQTVPAASSTPFPLIISQSKVEIIAYISLQAMRQRVTGKRLRAAPWSSCCLSPSIPALLVVKNDSPDWHWVGAELLYFK